MFLMIYIYYTGCHLDLCVENIMIKDAEFIEDKYGNITISPNATIKLCDFGVSEIFDIHCTKTDDDEHKECLFKCDKQNISLYNDTYHSPKQYNGEVYDARFADNWSLGMILFEALTNTKLYESNDIINNKNGFYALYHGKLRHYLNANNLAKYFNQHSFRLLSQLLRINDKRRISGMDILTNPWFNKYFIRYKSQITKKFKLQQKEISQQKQKMNNMEFPFYHL